MKLKTAIKIEEPYTGISEEDYQVEKRRLQVELLQIQQKVLKNGLRLAILFEGRDAAGKGSTIKRFTEISKDSFLILISRHLRYRPSRKIMKPDISVESI